MNNRCCHISQHIDFQLLTKRITSNYLQLRKIKINTFSGDIQQNKEKSRKFAL